MQSFIYRGYIIKYEIKDGKVVVSNVDYGDKQFHSDRVFDSIGELKRFTEAGGWKSEQFIIGE